MFGAVDGVIRTRVGYHGGSKKNPTYRSIGDHTETIQVDFDPKVVSFAKLVEIFWGNHDFRHRTSRPQYMSAAWYHSPAQEKVIRDSAKALQDKGSSVGTVIAPAGPFTFAEGYHQKYILRNRGSFMSPFNGMSDAEFIHSAAASKVAGYVAGYGTSKQLEKDRKITGLDDAQFEKLLDYVKQRENSRW